MGRPVHEDRRETRKGVTETCVRLQVSISLISPNSYLFSEATCVPPIPFSVSQIIPVLASLHIPVGAEIFSRHPTWKPVHVLPLQNSVNWPASVAWATSNLVVRVSNNECHTLGLLCTTELQCYYSLLPGPSYLALVMECFPLGSATRSILDRHGEEICYCFSEIEKGGRGHIQYL